MFKCKLIIILLFFGFLSPAFSQMEKSKDFLEMEVPKEQVYLHINSSLLFTGEKLLYKFYALETETGQLSELSKIGWVELVNNKGEIIFQHKVKLESGQGFSDFFVPSNLSSGAYKVIAYTNWMRNAPNNYFQQDFHILNPYQEDNSGIILKEDVKAQSQNPEVAKKDLNLILNKKVFSNRNQVKLQLDNLGKISGNFSISIRRIDSINKPKRVKSTAINKLYKDIVWNFTDTLFYPEIRGAFFRASIQTKNSDLLTAKNMAISSAGEEGQLQIVSINKNGTFSFTLNKIPYNDEFLFQLVGEKDSLYTIDIIENPKLNYNNLSFNPLILAKDDRKYILERSTNIQIENAFNTTKIDHFLDLGQHRHFFEKELIKYNLKNYKSFPSVSQTFTEIIKFGRIRKNKQGENIFLVRSKNPDTEFQKAALLIVDGVVVKDHEKLISYNPQEIKSISILRDKLFFGPAVFQGAISVNTKDGDFPIHFAESTVISKKIKTPRKSKSYYSPEYKTNNLKRIPDYRYQLLWKPKVKLKGLKKEIIFYTSDLDGKFEINLEGFTSEGKPLSINKTFKVE